MEDQLSRRSDRVEVRLPIVISGEDAGGASFIEYTYTLLISHHGAKIFSRRDLPPPKGRGNPPPLQIPEFPPRGKTV